ncbi:hypothetical protein EDC30_109138 [Paucimonas lemoignei]|uniref:Uncharacterized protein n=1 Tax=Paucimonas lemoignei TaxID=29443 RepID=A0A4R3HWR3_PAULE|nr:hypothetical protein [Paucimonas lemoignei]TCS35839.1 hypothetical protein EDC30_109138 [Paucimonas lemoignei]
MSIECGICERDARSGHADDCPRKTGISQPEELFYLQDSRSYVGNDVLWWAKDGNGYTTDLSKAHVYTKAEALALHESRETDIPWPKSYIDGKTRPAVDMQYIKRSEALAGTGIVLRTTKRHRETYRCEGCGVFMNVTAYYTAACAKCGTENRP